MAAHHRGRTALAAASLALTLGLVAMAASATPAGQYRLLLGPSQVTSSSPAADFSPLVDEQRELGDPPSGQPKTHPDLQLKEADFPVAAVVDLGEELPVATVWLFDTYNIGDLTVQTGAPGAWSAPKPLKTDLYMAWRQIRIDTPTRYLRLELASPAAIIAELAVDVWSPGGWQVESERQAAEQAREAERQAALARAREEALKRSVIDQPPYGRLSLVDEIDCSTEPAGREFAQAPAEASAVAQVLGRGCRVLTPRAGEAAYFSYRLGRRKLLRPGAAYVLVVDYPQDVARSTLVINCGNESSLGFYTGLAVGDALHAKYVDSLCESLNVPLSGRWEQWRHLFRLHDRFPAVGLPRDVTERPLLPEDGFDVTIATFSTENDPLSAGPAVARIALYEVVDEGQLVQPLAMPPAEVPHRRIFWREEMADGVVAGKTPETRGLTNELDWYRYKRDLAKFMGINTYAKDLLEFGACQHWDSTAHGGNTWVHFDGRTKDWWGQIVTLMGQAGLEVLPYYEYAGSRGDKGLGYERRAKPLTRDDAYTHIGWIENANADITDPDTLADFLKMLDITVFSQMDRAKFAGVWLRPRSQLPVGFGDPTRARFAKEANGGTSVSRDQLKADQALYQRYIEWWEGRRREFLIGIRDALRAKGLAQAEVLFTGQPGEPGASWADWTPRFVTDSPEAWQPIFAEPVHRPLDGEMNLFTPQQIVEQGLYRQALLAPGTNWGEWEVQHAHPADDPQHYAQTDGVMLTQAFNRLYTVSDATASDLFRSPAGLTLVRHYALNEHNLFDKADQQLLPYFICDVERAGPYCMMAEAQAVATSDPTQLGYLYGGNYGRGFAEYVRDFNANFLALPALPSQLELDAASAAGVVVRRIDVPGQGTWLAIVNTGWRPAQDVTVSVPPGLRVTRAVDGERLPIQDGRVTVDLRPCQLLTLRCQP